MTCAADDSEPAMAGAEPAAGDEEPRSSEDRSGPGSSPAIRRFSGIGIGTRRIARGLPLFVRRPSRARRPRRSSMRKRFVSGLLAPRWSSWARPARPLLTSRRLPVTPECRAATGRTSATPSLRRSEGCVPRKASPPRSRAARAGAQEAGASVSWTGGRPLPATSSRHEEHLNRILQPGER